MDALHVEIRRPGTLIQMRAMSVLLMSLGWLIVLLAGQRASLLLTIGMPVAWTAATGMIVYLFGGSAIWKASVTDAQLQVWPIWGRMRVWQWQDIAALEASPVRYGYGRTVMLHARARPGGILLSSTHNLAFDADQCALAAHCLSLGIPITGPLADQLQLDIECLRLEGRESTDRLVDKPAA